MADLFDNENTNYNSSLSNFIRRGDKKGAIHYLMSLSRNEFNEEVLRSGLSCISSKHSISEKIKHVLNQF